MGAPMKTRLGLARSVLGRRMLTQYLAAALLPILALAVLDYLHVTDTLQQARDAELVRDTLRKAWGWNGVVVSDYTGIKEMLVHGAAKDRTQAGELSMRATIDVDMISAIYIQEMRDSVKRGAIPVALVDAAVRRVLRAKQQLGLFEDPYRYCDAQREQTRILTKESRALAREAASQSIVLLKNAGAVLPLRKDLGSIAVVGALAVDARASLGSWPGLGQPADAVTVLEGIRRAVGPKTRVSYARGAAATSGDQSGFAEAERVAREADVVVAVVGEIDDMSGEARSRTGLKLPGAQQALLERLVKIGKPVVAVLMNGRPLALGWLDEHVPAILESWFLGVEMGAGVADVLFGDVNPSGKLPITFPRIRSMHAEQSKNNRGQQGVYRHEDEGNSISAG